MHEGRISVGLMLLNVHQNFNAHKNAEEKRCKKKEGKKIIQNTNDKFRAVHFVEFLAMD